MLSALTLSVVLISCPLTDYSSTNEKLDRSNFIEGVRAVFVSDASLVPYLHWPGQTKLLGTYLYEVATES